VILSNEPAGPDLGMADPFGFENIEDLRKRAVFI
jgi:hypothetical protein